MASNSGNYAPITSSRASSDDGSTTVVSASESQEFFPHSEKEYFRPKSHSQRRRFIDICVTVIATLVAMTVFQYAYRRATHNPRALFQTAIETYWGEEARKSPQYHCGNSFAEAIEQGCVFDISVTGWVPTQCYDADLHQRFVDWGWKYFEDKEGMREVPLDRVAATAGTREPFWVQHGYHVTHCELAWQRMHRAMQSGGRLTMHLLNFEHTHHCGGILEMGDDLYDINAQILPLLNTC